VGFAAALVVVRTVRMNGSNTIYGLTWVGDHSRSQQK